MKRITINHKTQKGSTSTMQCIKKGESELLNLLQAHYDATTQSCNHFKNLIDRIVWDKIFYEDGETYYCVNGFTLTVENINPFEEAWKPSVMFSDGSILPLA